MRSATYDADIEKMYGKAAPERLFTETAGKLKLNPNSYGYSYYPAGVEELTRTISDLFSKGEQAVWFDPSDISTLYQDAAGTTPVTAMEQPVGLMLDKSKGLVRGPELVTNGGFDSGTTGWALINTPSVVTESSSVVVTNTNNTSGYEMLSQEFGAVAGKTYECVFDVEPLTANTAVGEWTGATGKYSINLPLGRHTVRRFFTATSAHAEVRVGVMNTDAAALRVHAVSVRELPGNHCVFKAGTGRPVLSARYNLYVGTETLATQNVTTAATNYKLTFTGTGTITLSGTATGTYSAGTHTITCTAGTLTSTVAGTVTKADFRAANDGVGLTAYQRVTTSTDYDTAGFPPYLRADGTDDGGSTNSIDFTGTDKITVFAGVRKLSDAAKGIVAEFSATTVGNNGTYALTAPNAASATYGFESKGTALTDAIASATAPISSVISASGGISTDSNVIRVNGTQSDSDTGDQGTGNYGNYQLFLFARNNASLYFNGRLYGLIVLGRAATEAEIANTERYLNQRGRIY